MRLRIVTPLSVVVDAADVRKLRAEDASGGFGILPGHAEFLTALTVSVVSWENAEAVRHYCAVRRGILVVTATRDVEIATREAFVSDDLAALEATVLAGFRADIEAERTGRADAVRLQINAIRQIMRHLRGDGRSNPGMFQ